MPRECHSSKVDMSLQIGKDGETVVVSQVGPDFLILEKGILSACNYGKLTIEIDGTKHLYYVKFSTGFHPFERRQKIIETIPLTY